MAKTSAKSEYYCVAVRRNYETVWRVLSKHDTPEQAEIELQERRGYTGAFNYDNAELRVMSRTEARAVFGSKWDFTPIGGAQAAPAKPARPRRPSDD